MYPAIRPEQDFHAAGNNYRAFRQKRVNVDFFLQSNSSQPRWYFPDIPDLNKLYIVGIEAHLAAATEESDEDINTGSKSPSGLDYWSEYDAKFCFVNLVNHKKALICQNFPGYMFYNPETPSAIKTGKIMPINSYLLIRECYLFFVDSFNPNRDKTASFTFYHL